MGIECTFKLDQSLMEEADPESSRYASHAQRSFSSPFYLSCAAHLSRPKSSLAFADVASRRKHCASRFRAKENASPARHTLPFFFSLSFHPRPLFSLPPRNNNVPRQLLNQLLILTFCVSIFSHVPGPGAAF